MAKFVAVVSFSFVIAYLWVSAANPETSQDIRDGWRRIIDPPPVTATHTSIPMPTATTTPTATEPGQPRAR